MCMCKGPVEASEGSMLRDQDRAGWGVRGRHPARHISRARNFGFKTNGKPPKGLRQGSARFVFLKLLPWLQSGDWTDRGMRLDVWQPLGETGNNSGKR